MKQRELEQILETPNEELWLYILDSNNNKKGITFSKELPV